MPYKPIGPVAKAVLWRIDVARGEHLRAGKGDLLWSVIGRAMGWTQPTTSAITNAKRPIDIEELPGLAEALSVRIPHLPAVSPTCSHSLRH